VRAIFCRLGLVHQKDLNREVVIKVPLIRIAVRLSRFVGQRSGRWVSSLPTVFSPGHLLLLQAARPFVSGAAATADSYRK